VKTSDGKRHIPKANRRTFNKGKEKSNRRLVSLEKEGEINTTSFQGSRKKRPLTAGCFPRVLSSEGLFGERDGNPRETHSLGMTAEIGGDRLQGLSKILSERSTRGKNGIGAAKLALIVLIVDREGFDTYHWNVYD